MASYLLWFAFIILIFRLFYLYCCRNFGHWKRMGLNGPKPVVLLGTFHYKAKRPMAELELEWNRRYGDIYGLFLGSEPVLTVCRPQLIKDILARDFGNFYDRRHLGTYHEVVNQNLFFAVGDQWKHIRGIMSPSFTTSKLKTLYPLMVECVDNTIDYLAVLAREKAEINFKPVLANLTMDVIATTVFATKIQSNCDENNPFIQQGNKFFVFKAWRHLAAFLLPGWMAGCLMKSQFDEGVNQFFINISRHIIEERRSKGIKNDDLIQLLLDAVDGAGNRLNDNEILGQCWVLFLAGYETTMATLNYCIYELAMNPRIQNQLYQVLCHKTNKGQWLDHETINKIEYLEATIFETLRMYPPVIRLERRAAEDYRLSDTDIVVKKGHMIEISVYAVHHNADNYPRPGSFEPWRFMHKNRKTIKPFTYLPFGDGPRNCIGRKFAMMEIKLALAKLVLRFKFEPSASTQRPIVFNPVTPFLATKHNYLKATARA